MGIPALSSIVLYCIVLYCIVLYCIVLYCIVLYYSIVYSPEVTVFENIRLRVDEVLECTSVILQKDWTCF